MQWSATDQFGNLYIGESDAVTLEEFAPHLASLVEEVHARAEGPFTITVDLEYTELNGPNPDRVSHILRAPKLMCFHSDRSREEILRVFQMLVMEACEMKGVPQAEVKLG